jgi:signal transduction histidine kinase
MMTRIRALYADLAGRSARNRVPGTSNRIPELFERGAWTNAGGSGPGLAIVRQACTVMGATIHVEDRASGGAPSSVHFPLA